MKHLKTLLLLGAAGALAAAPASAQTKLVIGSWAPPSHHMNADVLPTLGKRIQDATQGRVTFEIKYDLAPPQGQFEAVRDGAQDIGWIFHGFSPNKFVAAQIMELPFLGAGAEAGSAAYWRVHEKYLAKADEHKGVVVIGLMTHGAGVIQSLRPIKSWADLKGLKTRLPGGIASRAGETFGAVAISVPAAKLYESLSSKAVEAVFVPADAQKSFRLAGVTKFMLRVPGNLYNGSFALVMNPKKFESLGKEDQDALKSVIGEKLSAYAGSKWDAADKAGYEAAKAAGTEVSDASPQMVEELKKVAAALEADWIKRASGKGYDPAAALKELRETAKSLEKK